MASALFSVRSQLLDISHTASTSGNWLFRHFEGFLTEKAGAGHRVTVLVMARAGLVAVDSVLAELTGHVAAGGQRTDKNNMC